MDPGKTPIRVLFLCTGNVCRSPMAEALLREIGGDRFDVHSAGYIPSDVHPLAIRVLDEVGIDASHQTSKHMETYLEAEPFDYVITLCENAAAVAPPFPGERHRMHWSVRDPIWAEGSVEQRMAVFRSVRDDLTARIRRFVDQIAQDDTSSSGPVRSDGKI